MDPSSTRRSPAISTFLTLLTTQLKNQNPLDPLDTNQFTQQLVQFAQVEQQIKQNTQLETLISIEKTRRPPPRSPIVGATVAIDGADRRVEQRKPPGPSTRPSRSSATVTIRNSTGQTVYSGSYALNTGTQTFSGTAGHNGVQWPDGNYTISVTGKDTSGQTVAIPSEIRAWSIRST